MKILIMKKENELGIIGLWDLAFQNWHLKTKKIFGLNVYYQIDLQTIMQNKILTNRAPYENDLLEDKTC